MNFGSLSKTTQTFVTNNAPSILSATAVVGAAATAFLAARGGMRASDKIHAEHSRRVIVGEDTAVFDTKDKIKLTWLEFAPAAGAASATITCVIFANRISASRLAAAGAMYALTQDKFDAYKAKVTEKLGMNNAKEIDEEATQQRVRNTRGSETIVLNGEDVLCFDAYSGRYFKSNMNKLESARNEVNLKMIRDRFCSLGDFWDMIGLDATAYSEDFGWTDRCPLEVEFKTMMSSDDRPALVLLYDVEPSVMSTKRWHD